MKSEPEKALQEIRERGLHLYVLERPILDFHALLPSQLEEHCQQLLEAAKKLESRGGVVALMHNEAQERSALLLLLLLTNQLRRQGKRVHWLREEAEPFLKSIELDKPLYMIVPHAPLREPEELLLDVHAGLVLLCSGTQKEGEKVAWETLLSRLPHKLYSLLPEDEQDQRFQDKLENAVQQEREQLQKLQVPLEAYKIVAFFDAWGVPIPLSLLAKLLGSHEGELADWISKQAQQWLFWVDYEQPPAVYVSTRDPAVAAYFTSELCQPGEEQKIYEQALQLADPLDHAERRALLRLLQALIWHGRHRIARALLSENLDTIRQLWQAGSPSEVLAWGKLFERLGLFPESEQIFRYGLTKEDNIYLQHAYARMLGLWARRHSTAREEKLQQARRLFEAATAQQPQNVYLWQSWADLEAKLQNLRAARTYFQHAYKLDPNNIYVLVAWADLEAEQGDAQEAEELLDKALKIDKANIYALNVLGRLKAAQLNYKEAKINFIKALSLDPVNLTTLHAWGVLLRDRGHWQKAEEFFEKARKLDPENPYVLQALGHLRLEQARRATELGATERHEALLHEAEELLQATLEAEPDNVQALIALAELGIERRDWRLAEEYLRRAREIDQGNLYVSTVRSKLERARGHPEVAESLLHEVLLVEPNNVAALNTLGQLLVERSKLEKARALFQRAITLCRQRLPKRDLIISLNAFARTEAEHGDPECAKALYEEAIKLDGENAYTLAAYARFLRKLGQTEEAHKLESRVKELQGTL